MSELLALGTSHKTAPLALRERLALPDGGAEALLGELLEQPDMHEAVALSTCNRTELYLVVGDPVEAETLVLGLLARHAGDPPDRARGRHVLPAQLRRRAPALPRRGGLESMIVGEAEVQGQVKRAYELALGARTTGPMTNQLFRAALATGKRVRTETAISRGRASVASVAVDAARATRSATCRAPRGDHRRRRDGRAHGAGAADQGVATMFVANRRRERALALAAALRRRLRLASTRCPPSSSPPTSSSPPPPRRTRSLGADELARVMDARARAGRCC